MTKEIQYYVLAKGGLYARRGFRVIGVTSEKGRQVYGRTEDDAATHVSASDVIHRFPAGTSLEFAKGAGKRADEEYARHEVAVRMAREELDRVYALRDQRTLEAAKGILATHPAPTQHTMDERT